MSKRMISVGLFALATAGMVAVAPVAASANSVSSVTNTAGSMVSAPASSSAHTVAPDGAHAYPSASSTVIGSVGFIDSEQVGYFWSAARGDSVTETFSGPNKIKKIKLALDVPTNGLVAGAHADWTVSVNGTDVGSFQIVSGQTGPVNQTYSFPKKTGGSYVVKMRVTNEVAGGAGAHTLRYAGAGPHSVTLKKK